MTALYVNKHIHVYTLEAAEDKVVFISGKVPRDEHH